MSANSETADPTARKKVVRSKERSDADMGCETKITTSSKGAKEGGGLPQGWRRVAVKDMADSIQYGHTASAVERKDGPRFLRITDIQDGRVDWSAVPSCDIPKQDIPKYRLASGDLVFARTGATTGKSFLIGECPEAVFASYLIRVRVSADVDSRYLSAFFQSPDYWRQIEGGKRGIGQPNVNGTVLGEVQFPVAPLPEQRRIVAEIEKQFTRLEAGVTALRRVQANLKRYRAAVLKAACEGRLVPNDAGLAKTGNRKANFETGEALLGRILTERRKNGQGRGKYKEPATPATGDLPPLPEDWAWATVEQLTSLVATGATPLRSKSDFWRGGNIPWVTSGALNSNFVTEASGFITPIAIQKTNAKLFPAGTLLVALYGEGKTRGKVSELQIEAATNQACAALLFDSTNSALRPYLKVFLHNNYEAVRLLASGGVQPNLSLSIMKLTIVPLPPLAEQTRIVAEVDRRLSVVDELEAVVSANLQRATRLRQSILQKAFTGDLL